MKIPEIHPPQFVTTSSVHAVQAAIENAVRLGLTWRLRPGTVRSNGVAAPESVPVIMDGDSTLVQARSMVGAVADGQRVWCVQVPPAGIYVLGVIGAVRTVPTVQTFTGSGTWTRPAGLAYARIRLVGGGGQCGGVAATGAGEASEGGGGGGGGYAESILEATSLAPTATVTIGAGGSTGGAGASGQTGGATLFGALMTGNGGGGGNSGSASSANTGSSGGDGGTATGGNVINIQGGDGGNGGIRAGESLLSNHGAASFLASEVGTAAFSSSGQAGHLYGGGGGSTRNNDSQSAQAGAAGAAGIVVVEEFYV